MNGAPKLLYLSIILSLWSTWTPDRDRRPRCCLVNRQAWWARSPCGRRYGRSWRSWSHIAERPGSHDGCNPCDRSRRYVRGWSCRWRDQPRNSSSRDHGSGSASPRSSAPMPPKNCKRQFSRWTHIYLSGTSIQPLRSPIGSSQRNILSIIRAVEFAIARLGSAAMPARHGPSSVGAAIRAPFSP